MQHIIGSKRLRPNRLFGSLKSGDILAKLPKEIGTDEYNVVFGLGRQVVGAGVVVNYTQNAPRDMILRKLILSDETNGDPRDFTVTAITIEGNAALLGAAVGGEVFGSQSYYSPDFDLPVAGGTPVTVTVTNNNAAARPMTAAFSID